MTKITLTKIIFFSIFVFISFGSIAEETIDDQVNSIANLLMCPVCQGQSVGESNSNLAHDMRDIIRKQLEEEKSKDEILAYFVNSYGESILASPPPKGINWLLWLLPGVGIIVGGVVITLFLVKAQKEDKSDEKKEVNTNLSDDNEYLKKIEEDIRSSD